MNSTYDRVTSCLTAVFVNKGQTPAVLHAGVRLDATLGLDSLDYAEMVVRLEEEFGFDPFAEGVPVGLETLSDLVRLYDRT